MNQIKIFTTGGTFDKVYEKKEGELHFEESLVPQILTDANVYAMEINISHLFAIDSKIMDTEQRIIIADACKSEPCSSIVIVHGTDTIVQTAQVIAGLKIQKTIVLVGAMTPYSFRHTDADTNLIASLSVAELLPIGVYVFGGGAVFPYDNVKKDTDAVKFFPINHEDWVSWLNNLRNRN